VFLAEPEHVALWGGGAGEAAPNLVGVFFFKEFVQGAEGSTADFVGFAARFVGVNEAAIFPPSLKDSLRLSLPLKLIPIYYSQRAVAYQ
jgi:hypothetical protein